jgi:hypothetical protein
MWILVAGVSGALAAGLGFLIRGDDRKYVRIAVIVVLMFVFNAIGRRVILRPYEADRVLRAIPAFEAIRQHEPEVYREVRADVMGSMSAGADHQAIRRNVHGHITKLFRRYAPRASDEALRRYFAVMVDEIEEVARKSPATAVKFVFPAEGEFVDISTFVDERTMKRDLEALAEVIRSGAGRPPQSVEKDRANELLQREMEKLASRYGERVDDLSRPRGAGVDPAAVTSMVVELYRGILALPADDGSIVLRHVLS